ncbi:MAG: rRNA pseudouridine synthase [Firmicutes bacterium]|nr:rRNA pseudouridine synthase [Bacillota bacterium]
MRERLARYLARSGVASRRRAEAVIAAGRVAVNGTVVTTPAFTVDPERDRVTVDGRPVHPEPRVYLMLNKPPGYVSTVSDPRGRPTVLDLVPRVGRLYPVGRLDADSEGLLLLTNDGELSLLLTHPRYGVPKTYRVWVAGVPDRGTLTRLARGVELEDGPTAPARVRLVRAGRAGSVLEVTLREGRKRQIRRMCAAVGHPVLRLVRVGLGPVNLGALPPGRWRELRPEEVAALRRAGRRGGRDRPRPG